MLIPEKKAFLRDAAEYSVVPVSKEIPADFETPLSLFLKSRGCFCSNRSSAESTSDAFPSSPAVEKCGITVTGRKVEVRGPNGNEESVTEKSPCPTPWRKCGVFLPG